MKRKFLLIPTVVFWLLYEITRPIERGELYAQTFQAFLVVSFVAPIHLRPGDSVMVDPHTMRVELIERAGVVVYRRMWEN